MEDVADPNEMEEAKNGGAEVKKQELEEEPHLTDDVFSMLYTGAKVWVRFALSHRYWHHIVGTHLTVHFPCLVLPQQQTIGVAHFSFQPLCSSCNQEC
jgi:hypothetical protein